VSLTFRWLGVAGVELNADGQPLVLDPFVSRPSITQMLRPLVANKELAATTLPRCNYVLVTHAHYDHLMDVAEVLQNTGASAYGSGNTCQLLHTLGTAASQVHEVGVGDRLSLGPYEVEVVRGQHSPIPFGWIFNGRLRPGLQPPLYAWDYRMDKCLGYGISVQGTRLLICAVEPQAAHVLFAGAQEPKEYYLRLFEGSTPTTFIPIHWDNFTRRLDKPLRRFARPGRMSVQQLASLAEVTVPKLQVIIPELFRNYALEPSEAVK
jgi:hypothetical protein